MDNADIPTGATSLIRRLLLCMFAGVFLHIGLSAYWYMIWRYFPYRDKPMMPPYGIFLTMPGIGIALNGVAGRVPEMCVALLIDTLIYGLLLFIAVTVWKQLLRLAK